MYTIMLEMQRNVEYVTEKPGVECQDFVICFIVIFHHEYAPSHTSKQVRNAEYSVAEFFTFDILTRPVISSEIFEYIDRFASKDRVFFGEGQRTINLIV